MAEYASKGVAGAGLGLGIAGTALGVLNGAGGLLGLGRNGIGGDINITAPDVEVAKLRAGYGYGVGAWGGCGGYGGHGCYGPYTSPFVSHYELDLNQQLNAKDAIITGQQSQLYTDRKVAELTAELNCFKAETANRFCYDEKLIEKNKCDIEKTNIDLHSNYYRMCKVIRPWDICPEPAMANASNPAAPFRPSCNCCNRVNGQADQAGG